jgi:hypothetical protein
VGSQKRAWVFWLVMALGLVGLSAYGLVVETRTVTVSQLRAAAYDGWGQDAERFGLSYRSRNATLTACQSYTDSLEALAQPTPRWQALLEACSGQTARILAGLPTSGRAWLLSASLAARQGDVEGLQTGLERSRRMAPHVHWQAAARSQLGDRNAEGREGAAAAGYGADIVTLLDSDIGTRLLAQRWVRGDSSLRERITGAADTAEEGAQARLVEQIQAAAAAGQQAR